MLYTDQMFIAAVETSFSIAQTLRLLGINRAQPYHYKQFHHTVSRLKLSVAHFSFQAVVKLRAKRQPLSALLVLDNNGPPKAIKARLIREKILPYRCAICANEGIWNGAPLVLHLDHINGNSRDDRLENLRFLCPNCHTQTSTYCGRNTLRKRPVKQHICGCGAAMGLYSKRCTKCASAYPG